jgi:WhiB family redox-sensing transcriptional regulator
MTENSVASRVRFLDARTEAAATLAASLPQLDDVRAGVLLLPCRVEDPDLWFAACPGQVERAKALCTGCPVQEGCLTGALERRETWGVWGGQLLDHGGVVPWKRPVGRPRKNGREPLHAIATVVPPASARSAIAGPACRRPQKNSGRDHDPPRHPSPRPYVTRKEQ